MIIKFFKENKLTFIALGIFLVISVIYFSPALNGYTLKMGDIKGYNGMKKELVDYDKLNDDQAVWTNSMFGGMPGYLIHFNKQNPVYSIYVFVAGLLKYPIFPLFFAFFSFYILARTLKTRFLISILGALAYGFSSYNFLIIEAGHITKMMAIAFFPGVLAGMVLMYRSKSNKLLLSFGFLSLFFALEIMVNHIQMTYYFILILIAFGVSEFVKYLKEKQLKQFFIRTGFIVLAGLLGLSANFTNYYFMYNYSKQSMRGPAEITVEPESKVKEITKTKEQAEFDKINSSKGLKRDYIVNWSYGKGETYNLLVPNAKGSNPLTNKMFEELAKSNPKMYNEINKKRSEARGYGFSGYWGNQPGTSGPNYIGAVIVLLAFLFLVFVNSPFKWALLFVVILAILLSWGNNFGGIEGDIKGSIKSMWFTNFFIDYIPLYSKFRAVSTILVVVNLALPIMAILFLNKLITQKQWFIDNFKKIIYAGGGFVGVILIIAIFPESFFDFTNVTENNILAKMGNKGMNELTSSIAIKNSLVNYRTGVFTASSFRTAGFAAAVFLLLLLFLKNKLKESIVLIGIVALGTVDLISHNLNFLNNDKAYNSTVKHSKYWEKKTGAENTPVANEGDQTIFNIETRNNPQITKTINQRRQETISNKKRLTQKDLESIKFSTLNFATNYRVFELDNPFNSSRASYFHKSIGGYHPAKLRRYQDMIDFYISKETRLINTGAFNKMNVLNMLNTKYFLYQGKLIYQNQYANGNAWFVNKIKWVKDNNEEILAIKNVDLKNTAIIHSKFKENVSDLSTIDSNANIILTDYQPNHLQYNSTSKKEGLAVFSEIYYEDGWNAYIDGKKTSHIRTNYITRGLLIPAGNHKIDFKFEPKSVGMANSISVISFLVIMLTIIGGLYFLNKKEIHAEKA